jgi:hypothetical protein
MIKNYNIPAPKWLRILRDCWNIIGSGVIAYLEIIRQVYNFSQNVMILTTGTIAFLGMMLTVACIFTGVQKLEEIAEAKDGQDNLG